MREAISTKDAPQAIGPYSQAIKANGLVFTSGQIAIDPETQQVITGDVAAQTDRVPRNSRKFLKLPAWSGKKCAHGLPEKYMIFCRRRRLRRAFQHSPAGPLDGRSRPSPKDVLQKSTCPRQRRLPSVVGRLTAHRTVRRYFCPSLRWLNSKEGVHMKIAVLGVVSFIAARLSQTLTHKPVHVVRPTLMH
jgi:hypothetical protein